MASMDGHFRSPNRMEIVCNPLSFQGTSFDILWYNCVCCLSRFVILIWTLVGRSISSGKDERSFVITCSMFVNPKFSIIDTHSPPMNASPLIRLYLEILSNEILKKGPAQTDKSLYILYQSDSYSSTAPCAAANLCWLSVHYRNLGNIMISQP